MSRRENLSDDLKAKNIDFGQKIKIHIVCHKCDQLKWFGHIPNCPFQGFKVSLRCSKDIEGDRRKSARKLENLQKKCDAKSQNEIWITDWSEDRIFRY